MSTLRIIWKAGPPGAASEAAAILRRVQLSGWEPGDPAALKHLLQQSHVEIQAPVSEPS